MPPTGSGSAPRLSSPSTSASTAPSRESSRYVPGIKCVFACGACSVLLLSTSVASLLACTALLAAAAGTFHLSAAWRGFVPPLQTLPLAATAGCRHLCRRSSYCAS